MDSPLNKAGVFIPISTAEMATLAVGEWVSDYVVVPTQPNSLSIVFGTSTEEISHLKATNVHLNNC